MTVTPDNWHERLTVDPDVPEEAIGVMAIQLEQWGCTCRPRLSRQVLPTSPEEVGKVVIVADHKDDCLLYRRVQAANN